MPAGLTGRDCAGMNAGIVDGYGAGVPFVLGAHTNTTATDYTVCQALPFRVRVLGVRVHTVENHALGTVRLYTGATPISNAIIAAVVDTDTLESTLDATYQILEAGDDLGLTSANSAHADVAVVLVRWDG